MTVKQKTKSRFTVQLILEIEFERELHYTRILGRQDAPEIRAVQARRRVVEVRRVQHVEDLPAELEPVLTDAEGLADTEIVLQARRPVERVGRQRAVGAGRGRSEGQRVEVVV